MPKNKGKGGKNRRRGKNENDNMKRELHIAEVEDGQAYGFVVKMLGNGRALITLLDENGKKESKNRLGHIRGKMRKKQWVNQGDIVCVSLREYEEATGDKMGKVDIILRYDDDERRALVKQGEISLDALDDDKNAGHGEVIDDDIDFGEVSDSEDGSEGGRGNLNRGGHKDLPTDSEDSDEEPVPRPSKPVQVKEKKRDPREFTLDDL